LPLLFPKIYTEAASKASPKQRLEKRRQNFGAGKILPRETDISRGENWFEKDYFCSKLSVVIE